MCTTGRNTGVSVSGGKSREFCRAIHPSLKLDQPPNVRTKCSANFFDITRLDGPEHGARIKQVGAHQARRQVGSEFLNGRWIPDVPSVQP
jgi:hypothetical protein